MKTTKKEVQEVLWGSWKGKVDLLVFIVNRLELFVFKHV